MEGVVKQLLSVLLLLFVQDDVYQQGKAQLEAKNYDAAEASFRQLLEMEPPTASKGYEGMALVDIGRKNYDKAVEDAKKSVELNGDSAEAHYSLGLAYGYKQDFKNAAPSLEKALELNPDNAYAHYQLGSAPIQAETLRSNHHSLGKIPADDAERAGSTADPVESEDRPRITCIQACSRVASARVEDSDAG
jgi:tetratricopeptide (TPR) repeat protein